MKKLLMTLALCLSLVTPTYAMDSTALSDASILGSSIEQGSSGGIPVGTVIAWPVTTNPEDADSWLECNGQTISSAQYPDLALLVGGSVPDYRGLFLRGYGSQSHSQNNGTTVGVTGTTHSSGTLGTVQGDGIRNIQGTVKGLDVASGAFSMGGGASVSKGTGVGQAYMYFDASRMTPTANEIRPVNTAVRYLIRALP